MNPVLTETDTVSGTLLDIRFHQNNFLIGKLDSGISIKGNMISPQVGMEYRFKGRWDTHPRWGKSFVFSEYKASYPTDLTAIRAYLMENCKWIGPEISKRLVNTYGEKTLETCKSQPDKVAEKIAGITHKRALEISEMLKNNEANEELQVRLKEIFAGIRISKRAMSQIIESYGREAPERIRQNPYQLIDDINGVSFITADEIAGKVGFDLKGRPRIQAGTEHILKESAFSGGHTCLPFSVLVEEAQKLLGVEADNIFEVVTQLVKEERLVKHENLIYLKNYYEDEKYVSERLLQLLDQEPIPGKADHSGLQEDQIEALNKAVKNHLFILTGAPGTGKTFTIKRIINSFSNANISLAAPTGKAAKRIYEESGMDALTIHKLLEPKMDGDKFVFTRNAANPLPADIVILDEVSMIDVSLMASFLRALAPTTRLIMVGDSYQLPSVGPGNILKDMISSDVIPKTELTIIKRQDEGLIIRNCHRIKNGQDIEFDNAESSDFFFLKRDSEDSIQETVLDLMSHRLKESYKIDPVKDVQIISPFRERTSLSCKAFNIVCQVKLNPSTGIDKCRFKVGDKVIQTQNQYDKGIINGDIGYIRSINIQERTIYVDFENPRREVQIPLNDNHLELAYCITCHKFQGSEAPIIIIPVHHSFGSLITQRNWLYTAVSRAKKVCIIVGHRKEITRIIKRNQQQKRYTSLDRFLCEKENGR